MYFIDEYEISPDGIYSIRQALGQTRAEFGDVIGVTDRTIWQWETGNSQPTPEYLEAIRKLVPDGADAE